MESILEPEWHLAALAVHVDLAVVEAVVVLVDSAVAAEVLAAAARAEVGNLPSF